MTGFAYSEKSRDNYSISAVLKSYNHRYLDIYINLPDTFIGLEPRVRDFLKERIIRGKVEFTLKENLQNSLPNLYLNEGLFKQYAKLYRSMIDKENLQDSLRLNHFLRIEGLLESQQVLDMESGWEFIKEILHTLFEEFEKQRQREGQATANDILDKLQKLKESRKLILEQAEPAEKKFKNNLRERFQEVLGDQLEESRMLAETAVLLARYDINEELVRLDAHFQQFQEITKQKGALGKKMDFLCQEINREINTIGSKSATMKIQQEVVNIKDNLEMIREQLRNVE